MEDDHTIAPAPSVDIALYSLGRSSTADLPGIQKQTRTLENIRSELTECVSGETIPKEEALTITRLFHDIECLHMHECYSRDRALLDTESSLEKERLQAECGRLTRLKMSDDANIAQLTEELQQQQLARASSKRR